MTGKRKARPSNGPATKSAQGPAKKAGSKPGTSKTSTSKSTSRSAAKSGAKGAAGGSGGGGRRGTTAKGGSGNGGDKGRGKGSGKQRGWLFKTFKWASISGLVLALIALVGFVFLYQTIDIPDPNKDFQTETTHVYYADGKTELGSFATQNRDSIPLDEMPDTVKDGVVAAENQSFWTDNGIDPKGILRAAFSNASGNDQQGASTITQQYVKILYLTQERSYSRKVKEAIVSLKLKRQTSKSEILEGYLNTIYFGRGAYGIQAAAKAFFGKDAKDLNLRQSAVLSSVINNPTRFDPANGTANREALKGRYDYVLGEMADTGKISAEAAEKAQRKLPKFPKIPAESSYAGQKGFMLDLIRSELLDQGISQEQIDGGGLKVYTTISKKAMDAAKNGVLSQRPKGKKGLHVAVASVQPGTGALRGFYGGQDYLDSQINWALSGGSPGSTFKAFALAAAIKDGFSLKDTFDGNSPYTYPGGDTVRNAGGRSYGTVNMIKATEDSINTAFSDLTESMTNGPQDIMDMAIRLGVPKWDKSQSGLNHLHNSPGLVPNSGIAFGSATVSPINMANAYATIANGGVKADVFVIDKVVDASGEELYSHKVTTKRVLDEDIAADVSYAMEQTVVQGSGYNAVALGRPAAGKTGTATNAKDQVSSSWFVGFTPQMSTAVMYVRGTGNENLEGFLEPYFGGSYPALTWTSVMQPIMEGEPVEELADPVYVDGEAPSDGHAPYTPPPSPTKKAPKPKPKPTKKAPEPAPTTKKPKPTKPPKPSDTPSVPTTPSPTTPPPTDPNPEPPGNGNLLAN